MFRRIDCLNILWAFIVLWGIPFFNHEMQFTYTEWFAFPLMITEFIVAISGVVTVANTFAHIAMEFDK